MKNRRALPYNPLDPDGPDPASRSTAQRLSPQDLTR